MSLARLRRVHWIIIAEVLVLVLVLAAPGTQAVRRRREATMAAAQLNAIIATTEKYRTTTGAWPADAGPGWVPESLKPSLPSETSFLHGDYQFDWDYWRLSDGAERFSRQSEIAAFSVIAANPFLRHDIVRAMGSRRLNFTVGDRVTFVLSDPDSPIPSAPAAYETVRPVPPPPQAPSNRRRHHR